MPTCKFSMREQSWKTRSAEGRADWAWKSQPLNTVGDGYVRCSGHSFWTEKHEISKAPSSYDP